MLPYVISSSHLQGLANSLPIRIDEVLPYLTLNTWPHLQAISLVHTIGPCELNSSQSSPFVFAARLGRPSFLACT